MKKLPLPKIDLNHPPQEAVEYLKGKGYNLTFDYDEMEKEAHHKAFTVAKVTRIDLLNDLFTSLNESLKSGETFQDWKEKIKPALRKKGWLGHVTVTDPKTGVAKDIYVGARRLRTIFETNMQVSYSVARYHQMQQLTESVYWYYVSALLKNSRDNHTARHGTVKHKDDPWWEANYPPNGWRCKCKVRAYSESTLKKKKLGVAEVGKDGNIKVVKKHITPSKGKLADIADKDWDYNPGLKSKVARLNAINLDSSLSQLPDIKNIKDPKGKEMTETELKELFYKEMGVKPGDTFVDVIGDPTVIDDELFIDRSYSEKTSKIKKADRDYFIRELAKTIKQPDEIWIEHDARNNRMVKKMWRYAREGESKRGFQIIFEYKPDKTQGVTAYYVSKPGQTEGRRKDRLIYRKPEGINK